MKNNFFIELAKKVTLFALLITFISIKSCKIDNSQNTPLSSKLYSCDPEINEWVLNNLTLISTLSREDLIKLDAVKQRAAFRSLSSERKLQIWQEKLNKEIVICNTEEERDHILKLLSMTSIQLYTDTIFRNNFVHEANNWYNEGVQKFGWTSFKLGLMVATLYLSDESDKTEELSKLKSIAPKPDCACARSLFCPMFSTCDQNADCTVKNSGCGWLWGEMCIGLCSYGK